MVVPLIVFVIIAETETEIGLVAAAMNFVDELKNSN